MFKLEEEKDLMEDLSLLEQFIGKHEVHVNKHLRPLWDAYNNKYKIFKMQKKPDFKPDNRIAVNFAKYIADTMNGFFLGVPIKIVSPDENVSEFIRVINKYNDSDNANAELGKLCDIFGKGYDMYYVDDEGQLCFTYCSPMEAFMVFDDSILERPRYFVRQYRDRLGRIKGSISDDRIIKYFSRSPQIAWIGEEKVHGFEGVPAERYMENEEMLGIFETVMPMIDAYNKAISEKANDVDYFADAYMKILGARLESSELNDFRSRRIINFGGKGAGDMVVDFLQKPNGDTTQENLINRLEKLIFQISMVANISDESFGTASGISLKYKLQAMSNLAKTKERKFASSLSRRYQMLMSNPINTSVPKDAWVNLEYQFTQNFPANLQEEAQIAGQLAGITSRQTQLKVISAVDDVDAELERIEEENDTTGYNTDYPTNRTVEEE